MTTIRDILNDLVEDVKLIYEDEGTDDSESVSRREELVEEAEHKIADLLARIQR